MSERTHAPHQESESEKRLKLIFDSAPVGIIQLDEERRYISANAAFEKFIGYSFDELKSMKMFEITHPEDRDATIKASEGFREPGFSLRRFEKRYVRKDGAVVWGLVTSRQVEDPQTGRKNLFTVVEDITDQKRRDLELQRAEAELELFFTASLDLMCVADTQGFFKRVNSAFMTTLGYTELELISRPFLDFVHPEDRERTIAEISRLSSGLPTLRFENRYRTSSGTYRMLSWIAAPDAKNQLIYATARDVTELRLNEIKMAYSSKMASLGEMAGGIAHEINNPLAIILGKVTTIKIQLDQRRLDLETLSEELTSIERTGQRIAKIIRGLRSFSRNAEADPMTKVPIARVIDDTLELCAERLKSCNISLRVNCSREVLVNCRPSQLSQVLMNLISNSFDAVEKLNDPWISIDVSKHNGRVLLSVEDCGSGIPPGIQEKMMQPFFTTKEVGKGTGLGLSISKGIVEDHGGHLIYDAEAPNTRFLVDLPEV